MPKNFRSVISISRVALQVMSMVALVGSTLMLSIWTISAFLGVAPWLSLLAGVQSEQLVDFGPQVQLCLTLLGVALISFLPSSIRVMRLEANHRSFELSTQDVAKAYMISHAADRDGAFASVDEFDGMRDRLAHLRKHPDLTHLEPEILELAAKMSFQSRDIAQIYSSEKIGRAKAFLSQRQEEIERFENLVMAASEQAKSLRSWMSRLDASEAETHRQIERLKGDLIEILPILRIDITEGAGIVNAPSHDGVVVEMKVENS